MKNEKVNAKIQKVKLRKKCKSESEKTNKVAQEEMNFYSEVENGIERRKIYNQTILDKERNEV